MHIIPISDRHAQVLAKAPLGNTYTKSDEPLTMQVTSETNPVLD